MTENWNNAITREFSNYVFIGNLMKYKKLVLNLHYSASFLSFM